MDDLTELAPSLRNLLARPGTFETLFPETTEDGLLQLLLDGLAEAQREGIMKDVDYDDGGMLEPEITKAQGSLIVLYAGIRMIRAELLNRVTHRRYEAGTAVFEEDYNATLYRDILAALKAQKDKIVDDLVDGGDVFGAFQMADQYLARIHPWQWAPHPAEA